MKPTRKPIAEPPRTGLEKTLHALAKTPNEAAVPVLIAALDSTQPEIQLVRDWRCWTAAASSASARFSDASTSTPTAVRSSTAGKAA